jgi:hypothetical protein
MARQSLASTKTRKEGQARTIQLGCPGLYVADYPQVKTLAGAFAKCVTLRKQSILTSSVRDIMITANADLDTDLDIKTLNGDQIGQQAELPAGEQQGAGEDQQPVA